MLCEIEKKLPLGFHDTLLRGLSIDFNSNIVIFDLYVDWIECFDIQRITPRRAYLYAYEFDYISIDPLPKNYESIAPDIIYIDKSINIGISKKKHKQLQNGYSLYSNCWKAGIHFSAKSCKLKFLDHIFTYNKNQTIRWNSYRHFSPDVEGFSQNPNIYNSISSSRLASFRKLSINYIKIDYLKKIVIISCDEIPSKHSHKTSNTQTSYLQFFGLHSCSLCHSKETINNFLLQNNIEQSKSSKYTSELTTGNILWLHPHSTQLQNLNTEVIQGADLVIVDSACDSHLIVPVDLMDDYSFIINDISSLHSNLIFNIDIIPMTSVVCRNAPQLQTATYSIKDSLYSFDLTLNNNKEKINIIATDFSILTI